LSFISI